MNTATAAAPLTPAESAALAREAAAKESAQKIVAAFDATAETRRLAPARLAKFDAETASAILDFEQKIAVTDSAPFSDASAISNGLVLREQKTRYAAARVTERASFLKQNEAEIAAVNEGVPTLREFFLAVRRAEFDAATAVLLPFFREGEDQQLNARGAAVECEAVKSPGAEVRDAKDPDMADYFIRRLRQYLAGEIAKAWLI